MKFRASLQVKKRDIISIAASKTTSAIRKTIAVFAMLSMGSFISTAQPLQINRETSIRGLSEDLGPHRVFINSKNQVVFFGMRDCDTCGFDEFRIYMLDQQLRTLSHAFVPLTGLWHQAGDIIETRDGGYIMIGSLSSGSNAQPGYDSDIQLAKISGTGTLEWEKRYTAAGNEEGIGVQQSADGGYLIIANTTANNAVMQNATGKNQIWLAKLDANGNDSWSKLLTNQYHNTATDFKKLKDGNFILCGGTHNDRPFGNNASKAEGLLMKFNDQGTILWQKHIGGNGDDEQFQKIAEDNAGDIFVAGYTRSTNFSGQPNRGEWDGWITKVSTVGDVLSMRLIGGSGNDRLTAIAISNSGVITAGGVTESYDGDVIQNVNQYNIWATSYQDGSINLRHGFFGHSAERRTYIEDIAIDGNSNVYCVSTAGWGNPFVHNALAKSEGWVFSLGESNLVKASVYVDLNNNGIKDADEKLFSDGKLEVSNNNTLAGQEYFSSGTGEFIAYTDTGSHTVRFISNNPNYTVFPSQQTVSFPRFGLRDSFMIRLIPNSGKPDLAINIMPHNIARPGFAVSYLITVTNRRSIAVNHPIIKLLKDPRLTIVSSAPVNSTSSGDTLIWDFPSRSIQDTLHIIVNARLAAPPVSAIGDRLISQVSVLYDQEDATPLDNSFVLSETAGGSFDPNDKSELHAGLFPVSLLNTDKFHYLVRFQNTGTDTAFNIVIRDTLPGTLLASELEMLAATHPYTMSIKNGNQVEWTFANVLLADSNVNEKASHGYLAFSVKPRSSLVIGDVVTNKASIYFDYNLPVQTNTTSTRIVDLTVAMPQPLISGLQKSYCGNDKVQAIRITNIPAAPQVAITVKLNGNLIIVDNKGSFSFDPTKLQSGRQNIDISFSANGTLSTLIDSFLITSPLKPVVALSSTTTVVNNGNTALQLTANPLAGGGAAPTYTFATDRGISKILQGPSNSNALLMVSQILNIGDNWIYVRMQSGEQCVTINTVLDSIKIVRLAVTGIVDVDFPTMVITAYPNPFKSEITVKGLQSSGTYMIQLVSGSGAVIRTEKVQHKAAVTFHNLDHAKGTYFLRLFDKKKNRWIGSMPVIGL